MATILLVVAAASAAAQAPGAGAVRSIVDSLQSVMRNAYVSADTGAQIADLLRRRLSAGAYDRMGSLKDLSAALTRDMRSVNGDTHLFVDLAPAAQSAPVRQAAPPGRALNYNFERVERLAGNVGYLRFNAFAGGPEALRTAESALRFLANTDAVIIDLRNSVGGSAEMSNFLISHFAPPDTQQSLSIYRRLENDTVTRWTMASVPGPRRPTVPLYVLVDHITRSAGEDFSFVLQNMHRAVIVGVATAGAGHNNMTVPLPNGLFTSVSITRVFDPRTHREWERVGVQPNLPTDPDSALSEAHRAALDTLARTAQDAARRTEMVRIREELDARRHPIHVTAAVLAQLGGNYGGAGVMTHRNGRLYVQARPALPFVELVPLGGRRFAAGATRYEFSGESPAVSVRVTTPDGGSTLFARLRTD